MTEPSTNQIDVNQFKELINKNSSIFRKYDISFVILAGSQIRNEAKWWSDIDLFASINNYENLNSKQRLEMLSSLNGTFARNTPYQNIEIRVLNELPIHLKFSIFSEGVIVYNDGSDVFFDTKGKTIRDFIDYKIWIDKYYKYQLEGIE